MAVGDVPGPGLFHLLRVPDGRQRFLFRRQLAPSLDVFIVPEEELQGLSAVLDIVQVVHEVVQGTRLHEVISMDTQELGRQARANEREECGS